MRKYEKARKVKEMIKKNEVKNEILRPIKLQSGNVLLGQR